MLKIRKGRISKKITGTTLVKYLFSLYRDSTSDSIDPHVIQEARSAISNVFVRKWSASVKARPRSLANRAVVLDLLHFLWAYDEDPFYTSRTRIQLSLAIMLLFYLGDRPGEIVESSKHRGSNEGLH